MHYKKKKVNVSLNNNLNQTLYNIVHDLFRNDRNPIMIDSLKNREGRQIFK